MHDEIDGRIWVAHHEEFSETVGDGLAALKSFVGRLPVWDGSTVQLIALIASFAITGLTFNVTAA